MDLLSLFEKILKKIKERIKSPVLWTSILILLIKELGIKDEFNFSDETLKNIVDYIVNILIVLGLFNNPTNNKFNKNK